jgi:hypothetical protein
MVHTEDVTKKTLYNATMKRNQSDLHWYILNQLDATIIEIQKLRQLSDFDINCVKQMCSLVYRRDFLSSQLDNLENN